MSIEDLFVARPEVDRITLWRNARDGLAYGLRAKVGETHFEVSSSDIDTGLLALSEWLEDRAPKCTSS